MASESSSKKLSDAKKTSSQGRFAAAMLITFGAYGLLSFACTFIFLQFVFGKLGEWGLVFNAIGTSVISASVVGCASWAVFGTGSFHVRLFWSVVAFAPALLGTMLAITIELDLPRAEVATDGSLLLLPLSFLSAQLPFWPFRIFKGWQYVPRGRTVSGSYDLRDLFTITLFVAAAFGALGVFLKSDSIPGLESSLSEEGSIENSAMREALRREMVFGVITSATLPILIISTLSLPIVFLVNRCLKLKTGYFLSAIYLLVLGSLLAIVVSSVSGGGGGSGAGGSLSELSIGLTCFGFFLSIPILIAKSYGIELTNPHRTAQLNHAALLGGMKGMEIPDDNQESSQPNI